MKYSPFIILVFLLISCQDKVTETKFKEVTTPALCPPGNPELAASPHSFSGITGIENISQTSLDVLWEEANEFYGFQIIEIGQLERKIIKTVLGKKTKVTLNGLNPNTNYTFLVRAIDKKGYLEANTETLSVKTKDWPNFSNQRSLSFNGAQSIELGTSKEMLSKSVFTIGFWIKIDPSLKQNSYVLSFHRDNFRASSALAIIIKNNTLQVKLGNKKFKPNYIIADMDWKYLTLTSNGKALFLYANGERILKINEKTPARGLFKASVASFTGVRKGFQGKLDELAIFHTYMSKNKVLELYNNGRPLNYPLHSQASKLKFWYQFGDHNLDGPNQIIDHISGIEGTPLNIDNSSFTNDSP